jgi:hypothetical protein
MGSLENPSTTFASMFGWVALHFAIAALMLVTSCPFHGIAAQTHLGHNEREREGGRERETLD